MDIVTMGKVVVPARIENLQDYYSCEDGKLAPDRIRAVDVAEALVDTGATTLSMPRRLIQQLGLRRSRTQRMRTAVGTVVFSFYEPVRLLVQERECVTEVAELPDECPVLIGQVPLEMLDFVVDAAGRKLIGNPEHGGEQMLELF